MLKFASWRLGLFCLVFLFDNALSLFPNRTVILSKLDGQGVNKIRFLKVKIEGKFLRTKCFTKIICIETFLDLPVKIKMFYKEVF